MTKTLQGKGNRIGTRSKPSWHQLITASGKKIGSSHHQVPLECCVYLGSGGSTTAQALWTGEKKWQRSSSCEPPYHRSPAGDIWLQYSPSYCSYPSTRCLTFFSLSLHLSYSFFFQTRRLSLQTAYSHSAPRVQHACEAAFAGFLSSPNILLNDLLSQGSRGMEGLQWQPAWHLLLVLRCCKGHYEKWTSSRRDIWSSEWQFLPPKRGVAPSLL